MQPSRYCRVLPLLLALPLITCYCSADESHTVKHPSQGILQSLENRLEGTGLVAVVKELSFMLQGGKRKHWGGKRAYGDSIHGLFPRGRIVEGNLPVVVSLPSSGHPADSISVTDAQGKVLQTIRSPDPNFVYALERHSLRPGAYQILITSGGNAYAWPFEVMAMTDLGSVTKALLMQKPTKGGIKDVETAVMDLYAHGFIYDTYALILSSQI